MEDPPSILEAANRMDYEEVRRIAETYPESVHRRSSDLENALHILVQGGAFRTAPIIEYLLDSTDISTHEKDYWGRDPLDLALELHDERAAQLIYPHWLVEARRLRHDENQSNIRVVKFDDPEP